MVIRPVKSGQTDEIEAFLHLTQRIEHERDFPFYQSGEAIQTVEEQAEQIQRIHQSQNSELLIALSENEWVGYAMALGGELRMDRHVALIVVEVIQSMQRKGIATTLLQSLEGWARQSGIRRLELHVLSSNEAAINLYFKLGYEREGLRREARLIGNQFVDEWIMGKLLGSIL
jgi:RimJ/RimL family protein N-acetyltransferase